MSVKDNKADWLLARVVDEVMKPSDRYGKHRIYQYRSAVRGYEDFRGSQQAACEVTPRGEGAASALPRLARSGPRPALQGTRWGGEPEGVGRRASFGQAHASRS